MDSALKKKIYNSMPESLKGMFGSVIRKRLIGNKVFLDQYAALEKADKMSEEELTKKQFELLKQTCVHAYEHTKYYKKLFDDAGFDPYKFTSFDEFSSKVPVLTKQMVIDHMDEINADDITGDYPATTGGSSGTRLQVNNAPDTFYIENAFIYHHEAKMGYDFRTSKTLLLAGEESETLCSTSPLYNMIRISGKFLTSKTMQEAVDFINKFKPDYITAMPSSVYQFCKLYAGGGYTLAQPVKGILFRSENIHPEQRKFIEKTLGCPSLAYYGSTERIAFGEEILGKDVVPQYRFNKLYGYTEFDPADGETIISTGFINPKMPLIRYKTDDFVKRIEDGVYNISGHRTAALVGKNGETFSVAYFAHLEDTFDKIEKYQLEQYEPGVVIINIVPRHELNATELAELKELFYKKCAGGLEIKLNVVDNVKLTPRGKFKLLMHSIDE